MRHQFCFKQNYLLYCAVATLCLLVVSSIYPFSVEFKGCVLIKTSLEAFWLSVEYSFLFVQTTVCMNLCEFEKET